MTKHATRVACSLLIAVAASACSSAPPAPPQLTYFQVHGVASLSDVSGERVPLVDARVTLHRDTNANGRIEADEIAEATTDASGNYAVQLPAAQAARVVLTVSHRDTAKLHRTYATAAGGADIELDVDLTRLHQLVCSGGTCAASDGKLKVIGLPPEVRARGRAFDPTTEKTAFPGAFSDSDGNLLISAAFSAVELEDAKGQPVSHLATPATLRMPVPRTTWASVTDIRLGTGAIEFPLYSFDDVSGQWRRDGEGVLEDAGGESIPEASLAAIKHGQYVGDVYAVGAVSHFSFWNVDWPIDSFGCVTGVVVDESDRPLPGSVVVARGLTYVGSSMPRTTGADGRFCTEVMRSESSLEDVDHNGQFGDVQKVALVATHGRFGAYVTAQMPTAQAECGDACLDVGKIRFSANDAGTTACRIKGRTVDAAGRPAAATVTLDADPTWLGYQRICDVAGPCTLSTTARKDGQFTLRAPLLGGGHVVASYLSSSIDGGHLYLQGATSLTACPRGEVSVMLKPADSVMGVTPVVPLRFPPLAGGDEPVPSPASVFGPLISATTSELSWPTHQKVARLRVTAPNGVPRWLIDAPAPGLTSPLAYGEVPTASTQRIPTAGKPSRLLKGDMVRLEYVNGQRDFITVQ